jgi:Co/Zn/Cd efflux system component
MTQSSSPASSRAIDPALARAVAIVALANLAFFGFEFVMARRIGSVSLLADSIDFLEDTALNLLILIALRWNDRARARVGMFLALVLLIPTVATIWTAIEKLLHPVAPEPWLLSATGFGALAVNLGCALLLTRFRHHQGSLTRAAFLSARNDSLANLAIIAAGIITLYWFSGWPDLLVGAGIAWMNATAAKAVWQTARAEHIAASA